MNKIADQLKLRDHSSDMLLNTEFTEDAMGRFLKYVYTGDYKFDSKDPSTYSAEVFSLFKIAAHLQVAELSDKCSLTLSNCLQQSNAFEIYKFAKGCGGHKELIQFCLDYTNRNAESLIQKISFTELPVDCVVEIVQQDKMCVKNEMSVFNAILRWGEAECRRINAEHEDANQMRMVIEKFLKWVRFPQMSHVEIKHVLSKKLLNIDEISSLLIYFMTPVDERETAKDGAYISTPRMYDPFVKLGWWYRLFPEDFGLDSLDMGALPVQSTTQQNSKGSTPNSSIFNLHSMKYGRSRLRNNLKKPDADAPDFDLCILQSSPIPNDTNVIARRKQQTTANKFRLILVLGKSRKTIELTKISAEECVLGLKRQIMEETHYPICYNVLHLGVAGSKLLYENGNTLNEFGVNDGDSLILNENKSPTEAKFCTDNCVLSLYSNCTLDKFFKYCNLIK